MGVFILRTFIAVLFVIYICCSTAVADGLDNIKLSHLDFDELPLVEINEGHFGDIKMRPKLRNIGRGLAPINFYSLPDYNSPNELILTTIVEDKKVFYPLVILLNEDYQPTSIIDKQVSLHRVNQYEVSASIRYMLITTDPSLYGDQLKYRRLTTSMVRMYNGERYRYVPVTTGTHDVDVVIANSGRIALSVPRSDY